MSELVDHRGTELKVGQKVVYNLSGEIAMGTIHAIKPRDSMYALDKLWTIEVMRDYPNSTVSSKKLSRVTNPKNLMVIETFEDRKRIFLETLNQLCRQVEHDPDVIDSYILVEIIEDVMDFVYGWCSPTLALRDE